MANVYQSSLERDGAGAMSLDALAASAGVDPELWALIPGLVGKVSTDFVWWYFGGRDGYNPAQCQAALEVEVKGLVLQATQFGNEIARSSKDVSPITQARLLFEKLFDEKYPLLRPLTAQEALMRLGEDAVSETDAFPFLTTCDPPHNLSPECVYSLSQTTPTLMTGDLEAQVRFIRSVSAGIGAALASLSREQVEVIVVGSERIRSELSPFFRFEREYPEGRDADYNFADLDTGGESIGAYISSQVNERQRGTWQGPEQTIVLVADAEKSRYAKGVLPHLIAERASGLHVFMTVDGLLTENMLKSFADYGQVFAGHGANLAGIARVLGMSSALDQQSSFPLLPWQVIRLGSQMERFWMLQG